MIQHEESISERLGIKIIDSSSNIDKYPQNSIFKQQYSLRPRSRKRKHIFLEDNDTFINSLQSNKSKSKAPPLSKYRRKNANARERTRMKEINAAFEMLRKAVPHMTQQEQQNEKLTKITTLKLAMKYISTLSELLSIKRNSFVLSDYHHSEECVIGLDNASQTIQIDNSKHNITDFILDLRGESFYKTALPTFFYDFPEQ
ncbi:twist-related protein-like [Diabrotica virgifera virgifera]|uniref:BHLH domain-containing protein n=1 Tax=Diabrotica virgifera virgifera TaxID=50390 RepID=A0ABM5IYK9_DIAVI|nr:twist-related protein-like [Diabrotica virgifera virgifera]XP_028149581.2 twist-related protein-like [Diabrotica virgifera virgifera]